MFSLLPVTFSASTHRRIVHFTTRSVIRTQYCFFPVHIVVFFRHHFVEIVRGYGHAHAAKISSRYSHTRSTVAENIVSTWSPFRARVRHECFICTKNRSTNGQITVNKCRDRVGHIRGMLERSDALSLRSTICFLKKNHDGEVARVIIHARRGYYFEHACHLMESHLRFSAITYNCFRLLHACDSRGSGMDRANAPGNYPLCSRFRI